MARFVSFVRAPLQLSVVSWLRPIVVIGCALALIFARFSFQF